MNIDSGAVAGQLDMVSRLAPISIGFNFVIAVGMAIYFWHPKLSGLIAVFLLATLAIDLASYLACRLWRKSAVVRRRATLALWVGVALATCSGLRFAIFANYLLPQTSMQDQIILACLMASLCASGIGFSTAPQLPLAFVAAIAVGVVQPLLAMGSLAHKTLAGLICFVGFCFLFVARLYKALVAERANMRADQKRGRMATEALLKDFESDASDILWETNEHNHLTHVSDRLAESLKMSVAELTHERAGLVLERIADPESAEVIEQLVECVAKREAFRSAILCFKLDDRKRWWQVSGKPIYDEQQRFAGYRGVATEITEKRETEQQLLFMALHDSLTGLPNRSHFERELAAAQLTKNSSFAVLALDLDHFKRVNDTLGHEAGDQLLIQVAHRIRRAAGPEALVARLSGDEFAILVSAGPFASLAGATALAKRLCDSLAKPVQLTEGLAKIGTSIGIAYAPDHGRADLMQKADIALYESKRTGKGRFAFYSEDMIVRAARRRRLEQDILPGLKLGQFFLVYQPIVSAATHKIMGFEALVRWRHPELGLIMPLEFVSVAENSGRIDVLGDWILAEACRFAVEMVAPLRMSVNVSSLQLAQRGYTASVAQVLKSTGLEPHRLELELTESAYLEASAEVRQILGDLRRMGVRLALDDFGTGFSSLSNLRDIPFDRLKIDRSFVTALPDDERDLSIVRAVVDIATAMGKGTVAEGVESLAQARCLLQLGCHELQGYHFAKPMTADIVMTFVAEQGQLLRA